MSIMVGRRWQEEGKGPGHVVSTVTKKKKMNAGSWPCLFSFLFSGGSKPLSFKVDFYFFLKFLQDTIQLTKKSTITPTQMWWADINTDHWQGLFSSWSVHPHCWLLCRAEPPYKLPHWPHAEWLYQVSFRLLTLHSELRSPSPSTPCLNRKHQCHRLSSPTAILWEVLLSNNFLWDAIFIIDGGF